MVASYTPFTAIAPPWVLVIDSQPLFAEGLRQLLDAEADLRCMTAGPDHDAIDIVVAREPVALAVIATDLHDGVKLFGTSLKQRHPALAVLGIGMGDNDAEACVDGGFDGFVDRTSRQSEMRTAVRALLMGQCHFSSSTIIEAMRRQRTAQERVEISQREQEVLGLMVRGCSTADIADQLYVSVHTVRTHVRHIFEKLGTHSKVETVLLALERNLV
jgi:DNA-binding NarL/FixJ family response regulator